MTQKTKLILVMIVVLLAGYVMLRPVFDTKELPLHKRITDYQDAFNSARQAGKPVFVELYSET